ncbi:MAG: hypothetical protein ACKV2V_31255 [Blastocatellia bacterium]
MRNNLQPLSFRALFLLCLTALCLLQMPAQEAPETRARVTGRRPPAPRQIAERFAPVIYQGLGDTPRMDYITRFDFDGDWRGDNNWNNAGNKSYTLDAWVYYSLVETETHYLIHYAFFHPRDYKGGLATSTIVGALLNEGLRRAGKDPSGGLADDVALSHENDLEGCLVAVEKNSAGQLTVRYVETLAHNKYLKYVPAGSRAGAGETIELRDQRPVLFVEPRGHGVSKYIGDKQQLKKSVRGVMTYSFSGEAQNPETATAKNTGYDLVSIYDTLWKQATAKENETYGETADFGAYAVQARKGAATEAGNLETAIGPLGAAFRGTVGFKNKARPPWGWFDQAEQNRPAGEFFLDPAGLLARHFRPGPEFSLVYVFHPYLKIGQ